MAKKSYTILVVDDMAANRELLQEHVQIIGHNTVLAENGLSALTQLKTHLVDLILLDIMMPEMDGIQLLERLASESDLKEIPVIVISATDDMSSVAKCINLGAVDYLTKPFNSEILSARIRAVLASKQIKEQEEAYKAKLKAYNLNLETRVAERTREVVATQLDLVHRLGRAAEYRDNETGTHIRRMSLYCVGLAKSMGLSWHECDMMKHASPLHDLGKIGIPDNILLKPGKLDPDEWEIMKTHTTIGAKILSRSESDILNFAKTIALTHHEKWDGSGYPEGLKGKEIPQAGRIVAICDVFDALTSVRPYKKAWSLEDTFAHLKEQAASHFDPEMVPLFLDMAPEILEIQKQHGDPLPEN